MKQVVNYTKSGAIATNAVVYGPFDLSTISRATVNCIAVQVITLGASLVLQMQTSLDGTNWTTVAAAQSGTGGLSADINAAGYWSANVSGRHVRIIASYGCASGSTALNISVQSGAMQMPQPASSSSATPSGTNTIGKVGVDVSAGAGVSQSVLDSCAATVNATLVKSSVGRLMGFTVYNNSATVHYIKFFNKSTAPVAGTDTPKVVFQIKASDVTFIDLSSLGGITFSSGIGYILTANNADLASNAVTAATLLHLHVWYV